MSKTAQVGDVSKYTLAVVMGGDGTVLRTVQLISGNHVPILGLNYGHLGFLTNSVDAGVEYLVELALNGELDVEKRSHLKVEIVTDSNKEIYYGLNEAVIRRDNSGKIVDYGININGEDVARLRGDGIIASTATGSTAYALSAGGPLIAPDYQGILLVSISPFTLNTRPLITGKNDHIVIDFRDDSDRENLSIYIDGKPIHINGQVLYAKIKADTTQTEILRYKSDSFYTRIAKTFFKL